LVFEQDEVIRFDKDGKPISITIRGVTPTGDSAETFAIDQAMARIMLPPEIQVKLHECFGVKEHPHVGEGKVPVKMWLATPDGKRLEATFNWPAFRTNTYPKLKSALQKKFPATLWV